MCIYLMTYIHSTKWWVFLQYKTYLTCIQAPIRFSSCVFSSSFSKIILFFFCLSQVRSHILGQHAHYLSEWLFTFNFYCLTSTKIYKIHLSSFHLRSPSFTHQNSSLQKVLPLSWSLFLCGYNINSAYCFRKFKWLNEY